ncbi:hypothetical protein ZHAS_00005529 [Anopheles sinensis]|uniref:Uncharacterized protein n=1 Tax=Anopheles sinensis TaxID=74873 RepID=A0A084VJS1_ANOSI|nr:hypothetical protein ZHAS_00005529 [Anopheles sinensis]
MESHYLGQYLPDGILLTEAARRPSSPHRGSMKEFERWEKPLPPAIVETTTTTAHVIPGETPIPTLELDDVGGGFLTHVHRNEIHKALHFREPAFFRVADKNGRPS